MLDAGLDQAAGLRAFMGTPAIHTLAFALPANHRGDASWIAQLAHALRAIGRKPLVVDGARGVVANAFALRLRHELIDLLQGNCDFDEVAQVTADGVHVMRADRGIEAFVASGAPASKLFDSFSRLSHGFNEVVLAMPGDELACLAGPEDSVPVIALPPGSSGMVEAYSLIKHLAGDFGFRRFACVVHGVDDLDRAADDHGRLAAAARRFTNAEIIFAGCLPSGRTEHAPKLRRVAQALLDISANTVNAPASND